MNALKTPNKKKTINESTQTPVKSNKMSSNGFAVGNSSVADSYANDINTVNNLKSNNLGKQASVAGAINNTNTTNTNTINNTNSVLGALKGAGNVFKNGIGKTVKNVATDNVNTIKDNIIDKYQQYISGDSNPETQGSTTAPVQSNNDAYWKDLQNQIKMNTLNSKNEVANAQRKASANMDNYLKMLGIQGTGLGQSQYTALASDYANKIADINNNEQQAMLDLEAERKAETDKMLETKQAEAQALIDAGGDATQIINNLKAQGYDTSYIESYMNAVNEQNAKAEAEDTKLSNEETLGQGKDMYYALNEKISAGGLSKPKAEELQGILNELGSAITSKDYERVAELYDKAENAYYGLSSTDSSASSSLPNGTYSVDTIKPSDFGDFTNIGNYNRQTYALEMLIEDSKKWTQTGENNGMIVDVNWGNGKQYYQFNAQNGTWKKISKSEAKDSDQTLHNLKDMYKSDIKKEHGGAMENIFDDYNWAIGLGKKLKK